VRQTDGKPGVGFRVKVIKLPNGEQISGQRLRELSTTDKGIDLLSNAIAEVWPRMSLGGILSFILHLMYG
jgi:hypothetical protein